MIVAIVTFWRWTSTLLLGLDRLVQTFAVAAAGHHAAGELVDDDDFAVADDVVLVAVEDRFGLERLFEVVRQVDVAVVVDALARRESRPVARLCRRLLRSGVARLVLEVDLVVPVVRAAARRSARTGSTGRSTRSA